MVPDRNGPCFFSPALRHACPVFDEYSPVNQNIAGPTAYGDPYHGYWIADITQLNPKFGTAQDLMDLSNELHKRKMYLMVDVVVNNVAATTTTPDYSPYLFKDGPYPIKWFHISDPDQ